MVFFTLRLISPFQVAVTSPAGTTTIETPSPLRTQPVADDGDGSNPSPPVVPNGTPAAVVDMEGDEDVAIRLSNAHKHYGSGSKQMPVLIGLDMEVKKGQIYGLLGKESPNHIENKRGRTPQF